MALHLDYIPVEFFPLIHPLLPLPLVPFRIANFLRAADRNPPGASAQIVAKLPLMDVDRVEPALPGGAADREPELMLAGVRVVLGATIDQ